MADSTKAGKGQNKRTATDENGSLAGASTSTSSPYDPATLLCKLHIYYTSRLYPFLYYIFVLYYKHNFLIHFIPFGLALYSMSAAYGSLGNLGALGGLNAQSALATSSAQSSNSSPKTTSSSKKSSKSSSNNILLADMPSSSSPNSSQSPSSASESAANLGGLGTLGVAASQAASLGMNQAST